MRSDRSREFENEVGERPIGKEQARPAIKFESNAEASHTSGRR